jgi:signal transduction histidine kinase
VTKHAQATLVQLLLNFTELAVRLRIQDNGCGFNPQEILRSDPKHQWGLIGIRERVALVGGDCDIASSPGNGTTIQVSIPLNEDTSNV